MNYSENLERVIQYELSKLIELKNNEDGPFDKEKVKFYYAKYEKIKGKSHKKNKK